MMKIERQKILHHSKFPLPVFLSILMNLLILPNAFALTANATKLLFLGNKNIAPVVYLDNGTPSGVAVDIVHALAKHIPQPIEVKAMDWQEAQTLVVQGEADALIQINQTEERKKIYDFSSTLLESQFSIFTGTNKVGISGRSSLRGLRVGVEQGGLPRQVLENDPDILLTIIPNFVEGFKLLNESAIDAVVVDYWVGSYIIAANNLRNIKVTGKPIAFSYSSIAVKKGNTSLLNAINNALQTIKADGTYQDILDKWRPQEVVFHTREQLAQRIYEVTIIILLVVFLIAMAWLLTLRNALAKKKTAKEKLREQYSTLRGIIDSTNALIFSVDRQYRYTSFNKGHAAVMKTLYGADIELGHSLLGYIPVTEDRKAVSRILDRALTGEHHMQEAYTGEELRSRQYFQILHSPIKTETGEIIGIAGLAHDITERRRAEETLVESEARYRSFFEDAPISLWEEDFSQVKRHIDGLREAGVSDWRAYFTAHPEEVAKCASETKIIGVNQATLKMFKAASKEHLLAGLGTIFSDESLVIFKEELIALAKGDTQFQSEAVQQTLTSEKLDTVVKLSIAPGYENTWEKAFVSVIDLTERKQAEETRQANFRFFEWMDTVNRAILGTNDLEQMMSDVLDIVLAAFDCDRAFLLYPCDPETPSWRCPMERTRPQYPGVRALGGEVPMDPEVAETMRILLAASDPVKFGPETGRPLPPEVAQRFGFQSFMAMAIYPRTGKSWEFGIHQCSYPRVWTADEERLFEEIGRRLTDALNSLLMLRNLRNSESKLAEAQRIAHFGYWDRDFGTNTITLSDEACRIFGLPPQGDLPLLGEWHEKWLQLIHPDDRPRVTQALTEALQGGPPYDVEYLVIRPNGEMRDIHSYAEVTRDESGRPHRMFGTMQDITERKKAEETIRQLNEELDLRVSERTSELQSKSQQLLGSRQALMNLVEDLNDKTEELEIAKLAAETANRAKSGFLANMSHELRTPLNAILGFAQLLARSQGLAKEHQENIAIIIRSGEHLLGLINDVLEIAKIEAGHTPLHVAPFDLHRLLQGIGEMFASRAEAGGLFFHSELDPLLPHYVAADAGKIRQVLINLLGNAIKFTRQGGVSLWVRRQASADEPAAISLHFEVEDSGIGIATEKVGVIFEPFIQAGSSKDQSAGTGLGLTISRHFVELMGGTLAARSTLGQGSVFSFDLPTTVVERAVIDEEQAPMQVKGLAPGQQAYRILIVEDREENRLLLRRMLEGVGFTVMEAVNGSEGVELFNSWQPDFVWMDIRMPVMDGFEATRQIKATQKGARTPVVALTASVFEEQRENILAAGCDGFVRKPFLDEEIWQTMEKLLGVRFLYEEKQPLSPAAPSSTALSSAALDLLDHQLLLDLARAVLACEQETCLALIGSIVPEQAPVAQALRHYVMQHKFDKLYEMLENYLSSPASENSSGPT